MKKILLPTILALSSCLLYSCKTYYIPLDSFKQQFASYDTSNMREVTTESPWGGKAHYKTYPIDSIACVTKKGKAMKLENGPFIEIRFTDANNKKTIFYFDLMRVTDSTVTGCESRIFPGIQKTLALNRITKIEVQDGGKKYHYVNR